MRFRGGGVGHKVTREWDEHLQREGRMLPAADLGDESDSSQPQDVEVGIGESDEEEGSTPGNGELDEDEDGNGNGNGENATGEDVDNEADPLIADEGEDLDEDVWAVEGYAAL